VGEGLSAPGPESPAGAAGDEAGAVIPRREPVIEPMLGNAAELPSHPPTEVGLTLPNRAMAPVQPVTESALPRARPAGAPVQPLIVPAPENLVRYGPGVPAATPGARVELTAERAWRDGPPAPARRRPRLRQVLGSVLTVILLAVSGVLFYLRFHNPPLHVTGAAIVRSGRAGCRVTVTGQISTNGGPGAVTYQWLFPIGPPLTLHQSVSAGQRAVNVQVTVDGSGHGKASQLVWLQVLRPDRRTASKSVLVSCP
jgi:hypothetical protein